ncbi:helix-turn-helix domain-containing protein [Persephonella sp.]
MPTLIEIASRCREKREELGISRHDLRDETKIPVDIIEKLEEDPDYIKKEPYAKFLIKQIARSLNVPFDLEEETKEIEPIPVKKEEKKGLVYRFLKLSFLSSLLFTFFLLSASFDRSEKSQKFYEFLNSTGIENSTETNIYQNKNRPIPTSITLKATGNVWLTVYVDNVQHIIKLRKGEKKIIKFKDKIKIETVGNPKDLVIMFNNKPVKLSYSKKILHNIFIDSDGIFLNGYNIAEKKES